jgi:hypothetical protein
LTTPAVIPLVKYLCNSKCQKSLGSFGHKFVRGIQFLGS